MPVPKYEGGHLVHPLSMLRRIPRVIGIESHRTGPDDENTTLVGVRPHFEMPPELVEYYEATAVIPYPPSDRSATK